jgi:hypothetical protein
MTEPASPTISIYQDPAHVEGILQQFRGGLVTDYSFTGDLKELTASDSKLAGGGEAGLEVKAPVVGGVKMAAKLSGEDGEKAEITIGRQDRLNYKYSSAFYLHQVRQDLRSQGLLKDLSDRDALVDLAVGDFVEFRAEFSPDEIISLMDVFNPQLIGEIARWVRRRAINDAIDATETDEERQAAVIHYQTKPEADAELARSIAEAIRVDFRSAATRLYFGRLETDPDYTAVTVCEMHNFLVDDADRILDGQFTVLGKVTTRPASTCLSSQGIKSSTGSNQRLWTWLRSGSMSWPTSRSKALMCQIMSKVR